MPAALPPAVGNAKADDRDAALLGFRIFFDARFSSNLQVRCATCHVPERDFHDGQPTSTGLATVDRNSPSTLHAAWQRWQTWDGKADSLWSQPLGAFENPKEMNFTRVEIAREIAADFRTRYETVFGALPPLDDTARFPARGKPGDPAWEAMSPADQLEINRVVANVGKALEAYMRKGSHGTGRLDLYAQGDAGVLTRQEEQGLVVFFKAGCDGCHSGPTLSDDDFHVLGVPPAPGKQVERGRAAGLEQLAGSPFSVSGPFHDGPAVAAARAPTAADEGAYHTPTLRNVTRTGPWGHNGTFATLEEVIDFHLKGGEGKVDPKLKPVKLTADERLALIAFMSALEVEDPPSPWNNWPDR